MKTNLYRFAVIGGDLRQVFLAEILAREGLEVKTYGLPKALEIGGGNSLKEALEGADVIAAPVPLCKEGVILGNRDCPDLSCENILKYARMGSRIYAGNIPPDFCTRAEQRKIRCVDYLEDLIVAVKNTVAVAEGTLAEAICRSPGNLFRSHCLVMGYGKCGAALTALLKKFDCRVSVWEREPDVRARASVTADWILEASELPAALEKANFIFNTVPEKILSKELLTHVQKESCILDIASSPGGLDHSAAKAMGLHSVLLPGLPGKYAPKSSAEILAEKIFRELK